MRTPGRETGSGTLLALAAAVIAIAVGAMLVLGVGAVLAEHRARATADLAALSAAAARDSGDDPCGAARRVAEENGAEVVSCSEVGDALDFVVSVVVAQRVLTGIGWLPATVEAEAHAGRLTTAP